MERGMKLKLQIVKHGASIYTGTHDVFDAETFGNACADAWLRIRREETEKETSIGALMEHLETNVLDRMNGAQINLEKA
jgi:hypothetical protein